MSTPPVQARIDLPLDAIGAFCQRWQITELALFGSALRADFRPDSDIDLLVTYAPQARRSLDAQIQMQAEIEALLGRRVDLVNRKSVERSPNYIRRRNILDSARTIYAA